MADRPSIDRQAHLRKIAEKIAADEKEFAADDESRRAGAPTGTISVKPERHGTVRGVGD